MSHWLKRYRVTLRKCVSARRGRPLLPLRQERDWQFSPTFSPSVVKQKNGVGVCQTWKVDLNSLNHDCPTPKTMSTRHELHSEAGDTTMSRGRQSYARCARRKSVFFTFFSSYCVGGDEGVYTLRSASGAWKVLSPRHQCLDDKFDLRSTSIAATPIYSTGGQLNSLDQVYYSAHNHCHHHQNHSSHDTSNGVWHHCRAVVFSIGSIISVYYPIAQNLWRCSDCRFIYLQSDNRYCDHRVYKS